MGEDLRELDLVFLCDCTGSMGTYIAEAQKNIKSIITTLQASEKADLQFALICYRDHPPQDYSYITRVFPFTSSVKEAQAYVDTMAADGGGDTPECIACAMKDILDLDFRKSALKVCVMISDAPPHGLTDSDGFPEGCPAGNDPMEITAKLMERGVVLYCVGVEPSICMGGTKEWLQALAEMTGGRYVPLSDAAGLSKIILYGATEELDLKKIEDQIAQEEVLVRKELGTEIDDEKVYEIVGANLAARGVRIRHLEVNAENAGAAAATTEIIRQMTGAKTLAAVKSILSSCGFISPWTSLIAPIPPFPFGIPSSSGPSEVVTYAEKADTGSLKYTSGSSAFFGSVPGGSAPVEKKEEAKPAPPPAPSGFFGVFSKPAAIESYSGAFFGIIPTAAPPADPSSSTFFGFGKASPSPGPFFGAVSGAEAPLPAPTSGAFFGTTTSAPPPSAARTSGAFFGTTSFAPPPSAAPPSSFYGAISSAASAAPTSSSSSAPFSFGFASTETASASSSLSGLPVNTSKASPFGFSATSSASTAEAGPTISSAAPLYGSAVPTSFSAAASVGYAQVDSSISTADVKRIRTRAKNMASSGI